MSMSLLIHNNLSSLRERIIVLRAHTRTIRPRTLDGYQISHLHLFQLSLSQCLGLPGGTGKQVAGFTAVTHDNVLGCLRSVLVDYDGVLGSIATVDTKNALEEDNHVMVIHAVEIWTENHIPTRTHKCTLISVHIYMHSHSHTQTH